MLGVLLVAVEEDLLAVHQRGQVPGQLSGRPAPCPHVQPLSEGRHQPAPQQNFMCCTEENSSGQIIVYLFKPHQADHRP